MRLVPMPGVVLVEPIKDDSIIQSTGRDYTNAAKVIAIEEDTDEFQTSVVGYPPHLQGEWKKNNRSSIHIGDTIFYDEYAYRRFEHEGKDIFAVDVRGDGVWLIGKEEQNDNITTEPVQEAGLPTPVPPSEAVK